MKKAAGRLIVLVVCLGSAFGKDQTITMMWPQEKPALKLVFDKFREVSKYAGQQSFLTDVTVQNVSDKQIPRAYFTVYFNDKSNVRIGEGALVISDLSPGQTMRIPFQFTCAGFPAGLMLLAKKDMLATPGVKTIVMKVVSIPPGATLKVDGEPAGATPVMVKLTVGNHTLDLAKEGYAPGTTPVEVTPDELPGGSITIELGGLSRDTVELRNGTALLGDVLSLTMTSVVVRVEGNDRTYDRNQVKKIMLVERVTTQQAPVVQPATAAGPK